MPHHRLQDWFRNTSSSPAAESAFVACPMLPFFTAEQAAHVSWVYQIAAARSRQQLEAPKSPRCPEFSIN